jgi:hypothetical protein
MTASLLTSTIFAWSDHVVSRVSGVQGARQFEVGSCQVRSALRTPDSVYPVSSGLELS